MGIYTNLATGSQSIKPGAPRIGLSRSSAQQLLAQASKYDPDISDTYAASDEKQDIPQQTSAGAGDTFTLTISVRRIDVGTFTTASIPYDATAATIETAIDVAATAAGVTDWTNGDISVSEDAAAGLSDGTLSLLFDGASVSEQPCELTVLTPTGWTQDGTITRRSDGGPDREAMQALYGLSIVSGAVPETGDAPSWTKPDNLTKRPRINLIKDLAVQSCYEEGTDEVYTAVAALYDLQ